ncbi:MAG: hypothetical protein ACYDB7_08790, partial [Mycobacteriales bacterium]
GLAGALLWVTSASLRRELTALPGYRLFPRVSAAAAAALVSLAVSLLWAAPRRRAAALGFLMALEAAAAFAVPQLSAPHAVRLDLAPVRYLDAHLGEQRFLTLGGDIAPLAPNYGSPLGLAELGVNDLPVPEAYASYLHTRLAPAADLTALALGEHQRAYAAAGVAYVLAPPGLAIGGLGPPVSRSATAVIYRLPGARALFSVLGGGPCRLFALSPTIARGVCATPAVVRWDELRLPGWQAVVNHGRVRLGTSGAVFSEVSLPAGRVSLTLTYLPPQAPLGLALGLLGLGVCATVAGRASRGQRRGRARQGDQRQGDDLDDALDARPDDR